MRLLALPAAVVLFAWPNMARPCSPAPCTVGGDLTPQGEFPSFLRGLLWTPRQEFGGTEVNADDVVLELANAPLRIPVTLELSTARPTTYLIVPSEPFVAGQDYVLTVPSTCPSGQETLVYSVEPVTATSLPGRLGELRVTRSERGPLTVSSGGGSCIAQLDAAQVDVEVVLSDDAEPWRNALLFRTFVDGNLWLPKVSAPADVPVGGSWIGRGVDRLFASCSDPLFGRPEVQLSLGRHTVMMQATIVGTTTVLESVPLTIELDCGPSTNDGGIPVDPTRGDGGLGMQGGLDEVEASCGCRAAKKSSNTSWLLFALVAVTRWAAGRRGRARS